MAKLAFTSLVPAQEGFHPTGFPNGINVGRGTQRAQVFQVLSSDLLALPATKVQLVASPTATPSGVLPGNGNYLLLLENVYWQYQSGSTQYTLGNADNAFQIEYVGKTATALATQPATGLVTVTPSVVVRSTVVNPGILSLANSSNLGLELNLVGTTPGLTLGNGVLYITMNWTVVTVFP